MPERFSAFRLQRSLERRFGVGDGRNGD